MPGAPETHPGKTGKVSPEWNWADGPHSEHLDAGGGGQAFEELRHVDLGGVRGEGAVPEDGPLGAGSGYGPDDRVRNAVVETGRQDAAVHLVDGAAADHPAGVGQVDAQAQVQQAGIEQIQVGAVLPDAGNSARI